MVFPLNPLRLPTLHAAPRPGEEGEVTANVSLVIRPIRGRYNPNFPGATEYIFGLGCSLTESAMGFQWRSCLGLAGPKDRVLYYLGCVGNKRTEVQLQQIDLDLPLERKQTRDGLDSPFFIQIYLLKKKTKEKIKFHFHPAEDMVRLLLSKIISRQLSGKDAFLLLSALHQCVVVVACFSRA